MPNRISVDQRTARHYLLAHQGLLPPRSLSGKKGILALFDRIGCIQFDPLDVVGRNPDLVLQSRIHGYRKNHLYELLYNDRDLLDGWDKLMSIFQSRDWPYFSRRREDYRGWAGGNPEILEVALPEVKAEVRDRGPVSSADIEREGKVAWPWGPTRIAKAALELLWARGELVIHRKERVRRIYDLTERHLPAALISLPDPFPSDDHYRAWYVKRRIGSVGLLSKQAGDEWLGVWNTKTPDRKRIIDELAAEGELTEVKIEKSSTPYYMRTEDLQRLNKIAIPADDRRASIIAPLDNLMWGRRNILQKIFDFTYVWEVYKPASDRLYGYYVLPVLYGDRFVARFEPARNNGKVLDISNWWWEDGIKPDIDMKEALLDCFSEFCGYVGTEGAKRAGNTRGDRTLAWLEKARPG